MATKAKKPAAVKKVAAKKPAQKVKAGTSAAADRKALFVAAYLDNGGNATQAAISAGYSPKTADQQGSRLLKDVKIKASISKKAASVLSKFELSIERTLREIARVAYSDPRRFYNPNGSMKPIHELDDDTAAAIASVEVDVLRRDGESVGETVKIKQWDKSAALEKAMKYHGLYEKDNAQRNPFAEMTDEQRRARIAELQARL